ncbi:MAG: ATP-binding cassette domain-containing protein, partial [Microvirga sp.]
MLAAVAVSKRFGGLVAVNGVSLTVERGSITGLIGPNGAGKTTLFALIAGFVAPTSGRILFEGRDVTTEPPHARARMGIARTFQIVQPFAGLSVAENIAVGAYLRHARRADAVSRAAAVARRVGLHAEIDRPAASLTVAGAQAPGARPRARDRAEDPPPRRGSGRPQPIRDPRHGAGDP